MSHTVPRGWTRAPFGEVLADVSGGNPKVPAARMQPTGRFPVIDQGQSQIAGYSDDPADVCRAELPVIIFGDHTRCFKFVDFPFCMGADGTKVLRPTNGADPKYLYQYLRHVELPAAGYSRHYKFLKEREIVLPPAAEQRRIAEVLDRADALRTKRRATLARLDGLAESIFRALFGDHNHGIRRWPARPFGDAVNGLRNGLSPSRSGQVIAKVLTLSAITGGRFDGKHWKESTFAATPPADQAVDSADFLICRGNGNVALVGRAHYPLRSMPDVTFPDTMIAARISTDLLQPAFLEHVWNGPAVRPQIESLARTTNGTYKVNQEMLKSILLPIPPIELQHEFGRRMHVVRKLEAVHRTSLAELDALFASLQHRAFRGEL